MKENNIEDALTAALNLLNNEFESVICEDLKMEYLSVINKLELAINEFKEN
jgi:hypothetical protein